MSALEPLLGEKVTVAAAADAFKFDVRLLPGGTAIAVAWGPDMAAAFEAPSVDSAAGQARAQIAKWRAA